MIQLRGRLVVGVLASNINNGVGLDNNLPWRSKHDMIIFSDITREGILVMGRKTLESLPSTFSTKKRVIVCLTTEPNKISGDLRNKFPRLVFTSDATLTGILKAVNPILMSEDNKENLPIFICGGVSIYKKFEDEMDCCFVSKIKHFGICDCHFEITSTNLIKNDSVYSSFHDASLVSEVEVYVNTKYLIRTDNNRDFAEMLIKFINKKKKRIDFVLNTGYFSEHEMRQTEIIKATMKYIEHCNLKKVNA